MEGGERDGVEKESNGRLDRERAIERAKERICRERDERREGERKPD
jgi:hypothetical protein